MENTTSITAGNITMEADDDHRDDFMNLAKSYTIYKIADVLNLYYSPVLIVVGIIGNVLSFLVMMQPHNRHMSMSYYLAAIALADTLVLLIGSTEYLSMSFGVEMPLGQYWFCCININTLFTAMLCSNLFILNMTFDRFYSIVRPHKAASFNTVKRAKVTIACIVLISTFVNIPHLFVTWHDAWLCLPFGNKRVMKRWYFQFYYWISFVVQYAIPFVSLLSMNGVIIHTLRKRTRLTKKREVGSRSQGQGQTSKMKSSEMQMYIILLLVTFTILILTTPGYSFFLINLFYDFAKSPKVFAGYHFYINTAQKMHYTNHGINFFLYVISGQKFRTDLKNLFSVKRAEQKVTNTSSTGDADTNLSMTAESAGRPDTSKNNKHFSEISGSVYV